MRRRVEPEVPEMTFMMREGLCETVIEGRSYPGDSLDVGEVAKTHRSPTRRTLAETVAIRCLILILYLNPLWALRPRGGVPAIQLNVSVSKRTHSS
jgi:hypothetical protein